jgi:6-phosphogluconolactonase
VPVTVLDNRNALMRAAADEVVGQAASALGRRGRFDWALAGGKTPEELYRLLASRDYVSRVDWSRVHFYWGDERCVPPEHPDSNYRMARASLLDAIRPPAENVHRMPGELEPTLAAERYEAELRRCFASREASSELPPSVQAFPAFDLILLGMGPDGHTASLFPGTPALAETRRWVAANPVEAHGTTRLTLTLPVLNAAARVLFLVAGADKAERLEEVLSGTSAASLPAQQVRPRGAEPLWFVDAAAGRLLSGGAS